MDLQEKIKANVVIDESGCWLWQKSKRSSGYGQICFDGRIEYVHRVSYEVFVGPIPEGQEIDHLCRVRHCANPKHLEPVSHADNIRRSDAVMGVNHRKTSCSNGHPFDEKNTRHKNGRRYCRACDADHHRNARASKRSA